MFKEGEEIFVSNSIEIHGWVKRIFLTKIPRAKKPFCCVTVGWYNEEPYKKGEKVRTTNWKYARKAVDLKMDDSIIVWISMESKRKRYFKEWTKDGKPICFSSGRNSWNIDEIKTCPAGKFKTWESWKLPGDK